MKTTTANISGTPEQFQSAKIEVEFYKITKWFSEECTVFVTFCKVIDSLVFTPSNLNEDLEIAIAEALGEHPNDIRIECEVEFTVKPRKIITEKKYDTVMLFI
jgi:hypothetical protein